MSDDVIHHYDPCSINWAKEFLRGLALKNYQHDAICHSLLAEFARANRLAGVERWAKPLTDEQIVAIRDEHLPSQGEPFDCIAFARAVLAAAEQQITALKKQNDEQAFLMTLASAHRDELEAQIAALRADAERWTLFRDKWCSDDVAFHMCIVDADAPAELDAAADAAREAKPTSERTDRGSS